MMNIEKLKKMYPIQKGVNNPILRAKSQEVDLIPEVKNFWKILLELMYEYDGVWLAAPQIWKNWRIIAVTFWQKRWKKYDFLWEEIMFNPKITWFSKETEIDEEACLSLPGVVWDVERSKEIIVEYIDINWNKRSKKLKWLNARIVQHEVDHLDWILFIDKIVDKKSNSFIKILV